VCCSRGENSANLEPATPAANAKSNATARSHVGHVGDEDIRKSVRMVCLIHGIGLRLLGLSTRQVKLV